jgi:hypothetical protein
MDVHGAPPFAKEDTMTDPQLTKQY